MSMHRLTQVLFCIFWLLLSHLAFGGIVLCSTQRVIEIVTILFYSILFYSTQHYTTLHYTTLHYAELYVPQVVRTQLLSGVQQQHVASRTTVHTKAFTTQNVENMEDESDKNKRQGYHRQ